MKPNRSDVRAANTYAFKNRFGGTTKWVLEDTFLAGCAHGRRAQKRQDIAAVKSADDTESMPLCNESGLYRSGRKHAFKRAIDAIKKGTK